MTKLCPKCDTERPLSEFPTRGKTKHGDKKYGYCKPCHSETQREYRLKRMFNLTLEEYDELLRHQDGQCYICGRPPKKQRLSVDHDHKTGLVRGLLCFTCNISIGRFRDDAERLVRAAEYVTHPPAPAALGREVYGVLGRTTNKRRKRPCIGAQQKQYRKSREKTASKSKSNTEVTSLV